jgi:hypothetical protein
MLVVRARPRTGAPRRQESHSRLFEHLLKQPVHRTRAGKTIKESCDPTQQIERNLFSYRNAPFARSSGWVAALR